MPRLSDLLLSFWNACDFRKKYGQNLTIEQYEEDMRYIAKLGAQITNEITRRQMRGIPAPDMDKNFTP